MNAEEFTDAVRDDNDTALSRLGSSKALYALTAGDLEDDVVLARAADRATHAADRFADWTAYKAFQAAAETERDHADTITDKLDDYDPGEPGGMDATLGELFDASARLGGLIGWAIVADTTYGQLTGYFTGQADPQTASLFREMRGDLEPVLAAAVEALDDADIELAKEAADEVVQAAYDEYFETLESLGVNPKPVC
jgi:hypothetical protein